MPNNQRIRGTEPGTGAERGTGTRRETAATGEGTGTGGGTRARTDAGTQAIVQVNKESGKSPAKAEGWRNPGDRPGTRTHPPGPRLGRPRSRRPRGRRGLRATDPRVIVNPLPGDMCPQTPGLDERKWHITSQRLKDSWNATNADTCALAEADFSHPLLDLCCGRLICSFESYSFQSEVFLTPFLEPTVLCYYLMLIMQLLLLKRAE